MFRCVGLARVRNLTFSPIFFSGYIYTRARNQLMTLGGRRVSARGPTFLNYTQQIFSRGWKILQEGLRSSDYGPVGYSCTVTCGYLTSYQKVLIYITHIEKVIAKLYSLTLRSEINDKQIIGQKFRLTPAKIVSSKEKNLGNMHFSTG